MLNSSALLRIGVLLVAAGLVAALVQALLPRGESLAELPSAQVEVASPEVASPEPADPAPRDTAPQEAEPAAPPSPGAAPIAPFPPAAPVVAPQPKIAPAAPDTAAPVQAPTTAAPATGPTGQAAIASAADNAGPRAVTLVDLNTASLAELNALRGGGSIGRAIIQRRPYAAVDQLLSKRVLSRATYDRIKDQVTAR